MNDKLAVYRNKRDFAVTGEPKGSVKRPGKRLRFSVQRHAARALHYDLRLELGGVALSWAVPKGPSFCTADKRLAVRVEDHPVDYMDFEGIIPKGEYGGGTVMLWDEGDWIPRSDPEEGLEKGSLKFRLEGRRLKGDWALVRIKSEENDAWLLIKERDEFAKKTAGIGAFTRGIRSGRSMSEIAGAAAENPFKRAEVMLARLTETPPTGKGWLFELKYDGHRTLAFSEGGKTVLFTRNGHDCTKTFPLAAEGITKVLNGRAAVLDGEMVVVGKDGLPDFGALQAYDGSGGGLCYVLFDLLALDGADLRDRPLLERKEKLKALLKNAPPVLSYSQHAEGMTAREREAVRSRGMEGLVIKRADSPYTAGKNGDWIKIKFRGSGEFVIGGYCKSETGELGSLLVGYYEKEDLVFAGRVGTGFSGKTRKELEEKLTVREKSPFRALPKKYSTAVFAEPDLIAQVEYAQITASGMLRQASFKGLRWDKSPKEVTENGGKTVKNAPKTRQKQQKTDQKTPKTSEKKTKKRMKTAAAAEVAGAAAVDGIVITHPEKVMFAKPKLTKFALAEYYSAAAERMLPLVKDRRLSLVCCPAGTEGEKFFRRHLEGTFEGVGFVPAEDGKEDFYLKNGRGLVSLAQYNAVEFHVRGCKKSSDRPDVMVFDLDPDEGLPLKKVRQGVAELKKVLDELGLVSFLKTSGGKGYHVVVPFRTGADPAQFRDFSREVALLLERTLPSLFTSNMSKKVRGGKIFLDWQRNSPGATSVAPYSVRARAGAPVSMPLFWEELSRIAPSAVSVRSALLRLSEPDPWADFFAVKAAQRLKKPHLPA